MDSQTLAGSYRLGFIGAGKLSGSIMRGLVRARFYLPHEIIASEPNENARTALQNELGITATTENGEAAKRSETVFVAVKPAVVLPALREISDKIKDKLVISLAAGVRLESMEKVAAARFMRALTNTPSAVCRAATAISRGARTTAGDFELAKTIFKAIGVVVDISEEQIDVV